MNSGTYVLVIKLESSVPIERPKAMVLEEGIYVYVGSAKRGLLSRLRRHLSKGKKIHWHIDQLTEKATPVFFAALLGRKLEQELSDFLEERFQVIEGFGSSDLSSKGNLFRVSSLSSFLAEFKEFCEKEGV